MDFQCPHCGFSFDLSPEYLADYGGCETTCTGCGKGFQLPASSETLADADVRGQIPVLNYSAPALSVHPKPGVWQHEGCVVFTRGKSLPRRCPRCNEPAPGKPTWLRMRFHPQRVVAIGRVARAIRAATAEETTLGVFFCPMHYKRYHVLGWVVPLIAICGMIVVDIAAGDVHGLALSIVSPVISIGAMAFSVVWWMAARPRFLVVAADKRYAWLAGCCPEFVASLPTLESAQGAHIVAAVENLEHLQDSDS
jgi:hypothetical protein